jgi:hypothetical protein
LLVADECPPDDEPGVFVESYQMSEGTKSTSMLSVIPYPRKKVGAIALRWIGEASVVVVKRLPYFALAIWLKTKAWTSH